MMTISNPHALDWQRILLLHLLTTSTSQSSVNFSLRVWIWTFSETNALLGALPKKGKSAPFFHPLRYLKSSPDSRETRHQDSKSIHWISSTNLHNVALMRKGKRRTNDVLTLLPHIFSRFFTIIANGDIKPSTLALLCTTYSVGLLKDEKDLTNCDPSESRLPFNTLLQLQSSTNTGVVLHNFSYLTILQ